MAMELDYDRSLYGVEHKAGPFDVTKDMVTACLLYTSPSPRD